jgi:DNA-dependent RNA polymerase auxiliary subunit epsilon
MTTSTVNFLIDIELKKKLRKMLIDQNVSITDFLTNLIDKEIEKYGKEQEEKSK